MIIEMFYYFQGFGQMCSWTESFLLFNEGITAKNDWTASTYYLWLLSQKRKLVTKLSFNFPDEFISENPIFFFLLSFFF